MKKLVAILALLVMLLDVLSAQTVDLRFTEFNYNNKLSSVFMQSVAQDQKGFMWFGTTNGLHRFDGYEMKNYLSSEGESFGITEYNIYKLYADSKGWLWISLNSNLCYYDYLTDSIKVVANESKPRGLDNYYITDYAEDADSNLFISTEKGIYRFNRDSVNFSPLVQLEKGSILNFIIDENGLFWIGTNAGAGVFQFNPQDGLLKKMDLKFKDGVEPSITDFEYYDNKLWIATEGQGTWSYDLNDGTFRNFPVYSEYELDAISLYKDKDGFLWLVDLTGLKLYVKDRDFFQGYYPEEGDAYSVHPYLKSIFQDKDHNYWTIHAPGGAAFCPKPKGIDRFDAHINSPFRLTSDNISAICEDKYGNLWMGNPFNGIDIFAWSKGKTITYHYDSSKPNSLGRGATGCIFCDSKQQMWVGTYWGGLQRYREATEDFYTYKHSDADPSSLTYNDVRSIAEDQEGNLWVAVHGKGVDKFDPLTEKFKNYNFQKNNLANDYTFKIVVDSMDNVWVGTAWGLSILPKGASTFKNYLTSLEDENSLSANLVNTIFVDHKGQIWVGTPQGLNLYLPETDNFKRIINGFTNKNIVSITEDFDHNIWVGTYYGISRYNPKTGKILNLNKDDGLISNDFLERSIFNNGKNTLFFGSINGINYFSPGELRLNNQPPEVYITGLKILNREITNHNSDLLSKNIIEPQTIRLDYSQKIIEIEFSALNYASPEKNQYAYYLEGFEEDWNDASFKRNVTYTNLDPGLYTFRVKAANNEGVWNDVGTHLNIIVKPPWWDTMAFKLSMILFIMGMIFLFIRIREKSLVNDKLVLEQKVNERTVELHQQKEELQNQKQLLEDANDFKNRFFNVLAHDLRGPIANMVQFGKLLQQRIEAGRVENLGEMINMNNQVVQSTSELLDDLLIWGKAQSNDIHLDLQIINVEELVEKGMESVRNIAVQKNITLTSGIANNVVAYADKQSIKTILRNLLSNAIKFSYPQSDVSIDSEIVDRELIISIADHGVGLTEEKLKELFNNNLKQSTTGTAGEKGTGMGLKLCQALVRLNGGKIWATSVPEKGSTFYFSLPLSEEQSQA